MTSWQAQVVAVASETVDVGSLDLSISCDPEFILAVARCRVPPARMPEPVMQLAESCSRDPGVHVPIDITYPNFWIWVERLTDTHS